MSWGLELVLGGVLTVSYLALITPKSQRLVRRVKPWWERLCVNEFQSERQKRVIINVPLRHL